MAPPPAVVKKSRFTVISGGSPTKASPPESALSPRGNVPKVSIDSNPLFPPSFSMEDVQNQSSSTAVVSAHPGLTQASVQTANIKPPQHPTSASSTPSTPLASGSGRTTPVAGGVGGSSAGAKKNRSRFTVKTLSVDVSISFIFTYVCIDWLGHRRTRKRWKVSPLHPQRQVLLKLKPLHATLFDFIFAQFAIISCSIVVVNSGGRIYSSSPIHLAHTDQTHQNHPPSDAAEGLHNHSYNTHTYQHINPSQGANLLATQQQNLLRLQQMMDASYQVCLSSLQPQLMYGSYSLSSVDASIHSKRNAHGQWSAQ